VAAATANHPHGPAATCLGAKVVIAAGAEIIHNSPATNFFRRVCFLVAAAAAANHPRSATATCLSAEVVIAAGVGVIRGSLVSGAGVVFCRIAYVYISNPWWSSVINGL
jgi:hypothetical protein